MIGLGVLGMSEGNGHPYSWAAIFNGYDPVAMEGCPFPVIPEYLSKQEFPKDTIAAASVTHIWCQEFNIAEHISRAANIPNIVANYIELTQLVDAVLLARDDANRHLEMSRPFLEMGLPIFIDKPLATTVAMAKEIFKLEKYPGQVFTCSALRYAEELQLTPKDYEQIGEIGLIEATISKSWDKYAVHIIEPVLNLIPNRGKLKQVKNTGTIDRSIVTVEWQNDCHALFKVIGELKCPLKITVYGNKGHKELVFRNTYSAFKNSLEQFIHSIHTKTQLIPKAQTLEIIEIIEKGAILER